MLNQAVKTVQLELKMRESNDLLNVVLYRAELAIGVNRPEG